MKKQILKASLTVLSLLLSASAHAEKSPVQSRLLGAWSLKEFTILSPDAQEASFCSGMTGTILYEKSGTMSVAINCGPTQTAAEPADAYGRILFYTAQFQIQGNQALHKVMNASDPTMIGKTQVRNIERLTDDSLVLTGPLGNRGQTLRIVWTREAATPQATDQSVAFLTYLKLKSGTEQAFLNELKHIIEFSKSETGNIAWYVQQSMDDPTEIVFYTRWIDQAAIEWHLNSPLLKKYIENTSGLLEKPAKLVKFRPLDLLGE